MRSQKGNDSVVGTPSITMTRPPVFVVGCPRSGTTLLQRMLSSHPEIAIAPETHFMRRFWVRRKSYGDLTVDQNFSRLVVDVVRMPEFDDMGIDPREFLDAVKIGERSLQAVFCALLEMFRVRQGAALVGEKTPNHLLYLPVLDGFFPGARFVQIVRDPRAVVVSLSRVPWAGRSFRGNAEYWNRFALATRKFTKSHPESLLTIRYEDLISSPASTLAGVCRHVGVEFNPVMLTFHRRNPSDLDLVREPWKAGVLKPLRSQGVPEWSRVLSKADLARVEAAASAGMRQFGYAPESPWHTMLPALAGTMVRVAMGDAKRTCRRFWRGFREVVSDVGLGGELHSPKSGALHP
jgi:hypothetical protein